MVPNTREKNTKHRPLTNFCKVITYISVLVLPLLLASCAGLLGADPVLEAKKAIADADPAMGDWQGSWRLDDGSDSGPLAAQVIALGEGGYRANFFDEFDTRAVALAVLEGRRDGTAVRFTGHGSSEGTSFEVRAAIGGGKLAGTFKGPGVDGGFVLERAIRLSPTLGAKPPAGAIVLFDGRNFRQWELTPPRKKPGVDSQPAEPSRAVQWRLIKGRAMEVNPRTGSIVTKRKFSDFKLHLEFRTPFMPDARGQKRGNSGVYLQGRYEVQVLDSYGLEGMDNECGGIYKVGRPLVNMCAPPMQWQTYDITFYAPRFDGAGVKTKDACVTVVHNGVTIHENLQIPKPTGGALDSNVDQPGGIYLQDHGNPVQFRNIWLVEL